MNEALLSLDPIPPIFNESSLLFLNITLAFIMFGVALTIKISNFKNVVLYPKAVITGILAQFLLLPALTYFLVIILDPTPSVALGMILVASCPGGNISNFITSHAKGNTELAFSLSAFSDSGAFILTPFNFAFWGNLYVMYMKQSGQMIIPIEIDPIHMLVLILFLLGIPLLIGVFVSSKFPETTRKIVKPIKVISLIIFFGYIVAAISQNIDKFQGAGLIIVSIVIVHNAFALFLGFLAGKAARLDFRDLKTVTIETGIQNSGLGLIVIFNFFVNDSNPLKNQLGGMAYVAAFWGIWHIVSGIVLATFWAKKKTAGEEPVYAK